MKRRVLNVPALIISILGLILGVAGVYGLHRWQLSRIASSLLTRAEAAESTANWSKAAEYFDRYLRLRPNDPAARGKLALAFTEFASSPTDRYQAIKLCYRALGEGNRSDEKKLRSKLAQLLIENGRALEGEKEADILLGLDPNDPQGHRAKCLAIYAQINEKSIPADRLEKLQYLEKLEVACALNSTDVELAAIASALYREQSDISQYEWKSLPEEVRLAKADAPLDTLVKNNPNLATAYLARFRYRLRNKLNDADADLRKAVELAPKDTDVLLTAAATALDLGASSQSAGSTDEANRHWRSAQAHFETVVNDAKANRSSWFVVSNAMLGLGDACLKLGNLTGALDTWKRGAKEFTSPHLQVMFHGRIADALIDADRGRDAAESLRSIDEILAKVDSSITKDAQFSLLQSQDLRHARLALAKDQFQTAIPILQRVLSRPLSGPEGKQIEFYACSQLGRAFSTAGDWVESAVAFDRAATIQPASYPTRLAAAHAWFNAGRPDNAADRAELVVSATGAYEAWFLLATAQFQLQMSLAANERHWKRLDEAFLALEKAPSDSQLPWRKDLLQVEYVVFRGRSEGDADRGRANARQLLTDAATKYSKVPAFCQRLVLVYESLGFTADADKSIESMREHGLPAVDVAIAKSRLLTNRKEYPQAQSALTAAMSTVPLADQPQLRRELIAVADASRDFPLMQRLLDTELAQQPGDLNLLVQRCELALERNDSAKLNELRNKLKGLGAIGSAWSLYFESAEFYTLADTAKNDVGSDKLRQLFAKALQSQENLLAVRPNWSRAHVLKGMIEERQENLENAATSYETAIQLGASQINVFERLIAILDRLNRSSEAEAYLGRLEAFLPLSQRLTEFAGGQELRRNPNRAIAMAREAVAKRPNDPQARVWLARLLLVNQQLNAAETEFKLAVEKSNDVVAWNGLFSFYLRTGAKDRAKEVLTQLGEKAQVPAAEREFILAQGLELLGEWKQAEEKYRTAAEQTPGNAMIQLRLGGLYLRSDPLQAINCLRRAVELDPKLASARRMLAAILASRGTEAEMRESEQLLSNVAGLNSLAAVEDRRLRALLLAQHGNPENAATATTLLEEIVARGTGSLPGDHLVLAQLYEHQSRLVASPEESTSKQRAARVQLTTIAARDEANANHLVALIDFLLRHDEAIEADPWLAKLESKVTAEDKPEDLALMCRIVELRIRQGSFAACQPWLERIASKHSNPTTALVLRGRWLCAQGQQQAAESEVDPKAMELMASRSESGAKTEVAKAVGDFYSENGLHQQAEQWYRRLSTLDQQHFPLVVMSLARQKRAKDAIQLCLERSANDQSSRYAVIAAAVLTELSSPEEAAALAEPLIQSALKSYPEDLSLLYSAATLLLVQSRDAESVAIFEKVVKINPRHVPALNNLALILAESPTRRKDALELIDKAIGIVGSHPSLLDTKGAILLHDGKAQQALPLLEVAARGNKVDPRHHLHLAAAYRDLSKSDLARDNLKLALDRDLETLVLTRSDQSLLTDLRSKLGL